MRHFFAGFLFLFSTHLAAGPTPAPPEAPPAEVPIGDFVRPNEEYPQRALPHFKAAPTGAYVAVGTERGFLGAANSPNVTELVLIDSDPGVATYNRINTQLLRIAPTREDYLRLRLPPDAKEWRLACETAGLPEAETQSLLKNLDGWKKGVAENPSFKAFHTRGRKFKGVNYLWDDQLFKRLQGLARDGRIRTIVGSLNDSEKVGALVEDLRERGVPLSVLDLSNAWWELYMPGKALPELLQRFETIAHADALVLTTQMPLFGLLRQMLVDRTLSPWNYRADPYSKVRAAGVDAFVKELRAQWTLTFGKPRFIKHLQDCGGIYGCLRRLR